MKKSDILRIINEKQNRVNTFYSITDRDLTKAQRAIKAMCSFGWEEEQAADKITTDLAAGVKTGINLI